MLAVFVRGIWLRILVSLSTAISFFFFYSQFFFLFLFFVCLCFSFLFPSFRYFIAERVEQARKKERVRSARSTAERAKKKKKLKAPRLFSLYTPRHYSSCRSVHRLRFRFSINRIIKGRKPFFIHQFTF